VSSSSSSGSSASRSLAGQTLSIPDLTGGAADVFGDAHPFVKLVVVMAVIFLGMELYGRWTGHYIGTLDVLGRNAIGEQINASAQTLSQKRAGVGGAGFSRVHSQ
jgi:hypothetical protein